MGIFAELKNRVLGTVGGVAGGSRRADGGTSCYRPVRKKGRDEAADRNHQPIVYAHTGFTGMNPPAEYGQPRYFTQDQPAQATAWQPQGQADYSQTGWQPGFGDSRTQGGTGYTPEVRGRQGGRSGRDNISYMPGVNPGPTGMAGHVEHLLTLTGLKSCYEAIECMRNGETLIVTTDTIANEGESMRCQDMLAGAAFTLGCQVRSLQSGRVVLIAPENVRILPEEAPRADVNTPPAFAAQAWGAPVSQPAPQAPAPEPMPRRERRVSANPNWEAARNGQRDNYNPYTGTMPVAAGNYSRFGGYGT